MSKLDTAPYKGVRDFYPEDQSILNYIFDKWREVAKSFGYVEYNASILEHSGIYKEKSGEEIVNDQTYTFIDRGDREVTLRPEMTPTVARMITARRRELGYPLRWYSIPNIFRYESPQKGRLREHWQLNVDLFGVASLEADVEIIEIAYRLMKDFDAKDGDFEIRLNDHSKKNGQLEEAVNRLKDRGISNTKIDTTLARGQAYYTGIVFEVFDTNPENKRSLFGGGRYNNLTEIFGGEPLSAVGFGAGDVSLKSFLEARGLIPEYESTARLMILPLDKKYFEEANKLATVLRLNGVNVAIDWTERKVGDEIKHADKQSIPYVLVLGEDEIKIKTYKIKNLRTGNEQKAKVEEIPGCVK
ncbi:MAG: histidine--tRNA ligase [bacterium]